MNIREGNRNEHHQMVQLGTLTLSSMFEGPINGGKGSYLVGGRYFTPSIFLALAASEKKRVPYYKVGFYDLTAKASYDIGPNSTLYASFYNGRDEFGMVDFTSTYNDLGAKINMRTDMGFVWGNIAGSLRYSSKLSDNAFLNITTYYTQLNSSLSVGSTDDDNNQYDSKIGSRLGELGLKAQVAQNITEWYDLSYGAHLTWQNFRPQWISMTYNQYSKAVDYGHRGLYTASLFAENKLRFQDFVFNVGGRLAVYNNGTATAVEFEPRVAATYYMPQGAGWISYTRNSQPLFAMSQMYASLPVDYWVPFRSCDELPTSNQISVGYKHSLGFGLDLQAEGYYKTTRDVSMVYRSSDYLLDEGGYDLGNGTAYGLELLALFF